MNVRYNSIYHSLAPEQRLAGPDRDHEALALPVEVLQLLPEAYVLRGSL